MTHFRPPRLLGRALLAAASALLLVGCVAVPELTPVPSDPRSGPTVSEPAIDVVTEPTPFIDQSCNELIPEESLYSALGVVVALAPTIDDEVASWRYPAYFALANNRGIHCRWTNGQPSTLDQNTINPDFVGVYLSVLPEAMADFDISESIKGVTCSDSGEGSILSCDAAALWGTTLMEIYILAPPANSDSQPEVIQAQAALWESVQARVAGAEPVAETYIAPNAIPLSLSCDQFITEESARAALGLANGVVFNGGNLDGGSLLGFLSLQTAKSDECIWVVPDGDYPSSDTVGIANAYLEGGEWAFTSLLARDPGRYEKVAVEGINAPDIAYLDCRDASNGCVVNLIIGHDWITFGAVDATRPGAVPVDRRVLIRLGELTAARLRG